MFCCFTYQSDEIQAKQSETRKTINLLSKAKRKNHVFRFSTDHGEKKKKT
jgi:hypothetical protein